MKNKKVVVTGGAGFVGSHLVDVLLDAGANVTVLDNLSHGRFVHPDADFFKADVSNTQTCRFFFDGAYAVFNLAAVVAGVDWNKDNGADMFKDNVNVLVPPAIAAAEEGVPHFVQMSSVCIYDPVNQNGSVEEDGQLGQPHPANGGYGYAKRMGELAALEWVDIEHVVVARPSNMYGPRDHFKPMAKAHVIPALIQRIDHSIDGGRIEVYGVPDAVREFMYVEDCAKALVHLVQNTSGKGVYNIGTGGDTAITIRHLAFKLAKALGKDVTPWWNADRGGGDDIRRSNATKIRSTGWEHSYDIDAGLEKTIDWYRKYVK